jgi:hypothetical protein
MMPFGIQLKGFAIGLIMAYLVIPWLQRLIASRSSAAPSA